MLTDVKIDPNLGEVRVGIEFGHTRVGGYRMNVWTPGNATPQEFGKGTNEDAIPDVFYIGFAASELISGPHPITITAGMHAVAPINGQADSTGLYSVIVHFAQDNVATGQTIPLPDSPFQFDGNLVNGTAPLIEHFKFVA